MSQQLALKYNLRIIEDSIFITGLDSTAHAQLAIADSIEIGDIMYRNVLFSIGSSTSVDSTCQIEALLGGRFLDDIGEFQIDNKLNQIIFPIIETPLPITGRNLMRNKSKPYLEVFSEKERLFFLFDTGYSFSNLTETYYNKHRDKIEKEGIKAIVHFVGVIEDIKEIPSYTLSSFPIQVGSVKSKIPEINVQAIPIRERFNSPDGVLGLDFLRMFDKITVNYNHMFVEVE